MPKTAKKIVCEPRERQAVEKLAASRAEEARLVERARMVLGCLNGEPVAGVARRMSVRPQTVIKWRERFERGGVGGLRDLPRPGKPPRYGPEFRAQVLGVLKEPPPEGQACWDGPAVAERLGASVHAVWRALRKEGVCLARQRSWCVSTDPEFVPKAAEAVGLCLDPPENAAVVSVDEKPCIQAVERAAGYVKTRDGKVARGYSSTYKRHGTLNLFAALEVATGAVKVQTTARKRRSEFLEFMDELVAGLPEREEIHVIVDNSSIHKNLGAWQDAHPNVFFHFTPTSASWLNQVEIWFSIFARKALRGASFESVAHLRKAIEAFVEAYNPKARPFAWKKREVKGAQLRDTVANFCN